MKSRRTIRYGIIGFGAFAERMIAPAVTASPNSSLVAVQKRSVDAAWEKARALNVPLAFSTPQDLVAHPDVDAVFITSANAAHAPETIVAANAGKHVLVEKPMAMNAVEAREMVDVCRLAGVKLMVGHMVRLSPVVLRVKQLILGGQIGPVRHIRAEFIYDARCSQRSWLFNKTVAGGGPLFDIAVHCIDTVRFILDDEVASIRAHLEPPPTAGTTESTAQISLRFSRGVLGSILASYAAPIRRSYLEVVGSEGILAVQDFTRSGITGSLHITVGRNGEAVEQRVETIEVHNLYADEVTQFSACILNDTPSPIPGEEGVKNQLILDEALKTGGT